MKKPDIRGIPEHDGSKFTWIPAPGKTGRVGYAEVSDLDPRFQSRVWTDSADVGFYVKSNRTGARKLFTLAEEVRSDGDVEAFVYRSESGHEIVLAND